MPATKPRPASSPASLAISAPSPDVFQLAREQGVVPVERLEDLLGGWPSEERGDGFEEALVRWRSLQTQART